MNDRQRRVAVGVAMTVAVIVLAQTLRRALRRRPMTSQVMTALLDQDIIVMRLSDDKLIRRAVDCESLETRRSDDSRTIEWRCSHHASESGRVALIPAPAGNGTELHLAMRSPKQHAKEVVRRMKMLLEAGEIATGARR